MGLSRTVSEKTISVEICQFPVYLTPRWRGSPWNFVSAQGEETTMTGLPDGEKSFKTGLAV